jgi:hypothetical protein
MRMGFGLLSLLITIGLIAYMWSTYNSAVSKGGAKARDQAQQISGRGPDGEPASKSVKLEAKTKNGQTESFEVTDVTPGGALEQYFGLKKGDSIVQVGDFPVKDYPGGESLAEAGVFEAAQRQWSLVVMRDGQKVTLSPNGGAAAGTSIPGLPNSVKIPTH